MRLPLSLILLTSVAAAQYQLDEALVLTGGSVRGRMPVHVDHVEAALLDGSLEVREGARLDAGTATLTWRTLKANEQGWLEDPALRGGYAAWTLTLEEAGVYLLEARGHGTVFVNGVPRQGDPYNHGFVTVPVALQAGPNLLLFSVGRGKLRARLDEAADAALLPADTTLPDLPAPSDGPMWGAIPVCNPGAAPFSGELRVYRGEAAARSAIRFIPALGVFKQPFAIPAGPDAEATLRLELWRRDGEGLRYCASETLRLATREPGQAIARTFLSAVDGSVQMYGLRAAHPVSDRRPGLVLSLHGAGVRALGQARAYASRPELHIVAPTNRRRFGFDWEDWGRLDALEVLEQAQAALVHDPSRVYLTGHSMGGHGTWQLGAHFPDRFAAIGPSAGWISFESYGGGIRFPTDDPLRALLARAALPSQTLDLRSNYAGLGIFVLHGDADDNVPVAQAREMMRVLGEFHEDFRGHEEPGAGHWWNRSPERGADCVDFKPMFDFFARRRLPGRGELRELDFATADPSISSRHHWLRVEAPQRYRVLSRARLRVEPLQRRVVGSTDNVRRLRLALRAVMQPGESLTVTLDDEPLAVAWPADGELWLARDPAWQVAGPPPPTAKRPGRAGPFKQAFQRRALLVYGTAGGPEENAWAEARARYDAEQFWYRGNGSFEVLPDSLFLRASEPGRNVVLYGNAVTNRAWSRLLDDELQVGPGAVRCGRHTLEGDDLHVLAVRPRKDDPDALVGVVAGTGLEGMRCGDRLPIFVSGAAWPDLTVYRADFLRRGSGAIVAAGFFGEDWSAAGGELELAGP